MQMTINNIICTNVLDLINSVQHYYFMLVRNNRAKDCSVIAQYYRAVDRAIYRAKEQRKIVLRQNGHFGHFNILATGLQNRQMISHARSCCFLEGCQ